MRLASKVLLCLLLLSAVVFSQEDSATKGLNELLHREWEYELGQNPTRASSLGDRRWNDRWRDLSLEAIKRRHEHKLSVLAELAKIDRSKLSRSDQLNYDLFKKEYETDVEAGRVAAMDHLTAWLRDNLPPDSGDARIVHGAQHRRTPD